MKQKERLAHALTWAKNRRREMAGKSPVRPAVYVIECQGFVKIGYSDDVWWRMAQMQSGNPFPLRLFGYIPTDDPIELEATLHVEFKQYRHRGEWFLLPDNVLKSLLERCLWRYYKSIES